MRLHAALAIVLLALGGAFVLSEMRKADAPVGPGPIVNLIADSQRELTRLPVKFVPLSDADEIKIGKSLEESWLPQGEDEEASRAMEAYVQKVGAQVAAHAHRKLPYRFHYVPSLDFINAFALPGGPVYIGGGLMALMDSEDELAAVLGHEIEHIDHYHCAERYQVQMALQRLPLGGLVALPVEVFVAGYSKDQEFEADREGVKLAAAASYSPQGAIRMFEAFERLYPTISKRSDSPQEELSGLARQTLEGYFRSHPLPNERIDQIRKMIAAGQAPAWTHTQPLAVAYYFLRERAWRSFQAGMPPPHPSLPPKERRARESERFRQNQEAARLASQSLALQPDQPRALEILALARFALGEYAAAATAYRRLLPDWPTFAASVGVYANVLAQQALDVDQYGHAAQITKQILELQPNLPDSSKILAMAQLSSSDFTGAAETSARLKTMYPQVAGEVRRFADRLAVAAWAKHQYQEVVNLDTLSLDLEPGEVPALTSLARAQSALANFSAAADAYAKLLDKRAWDAELLRAWGEALAGRDEKPPAAREMEVWLVRNPPSDPASALQARVELAGLLLLAGHEAPAKSLVDEIQMPPELLGRLGWWYYRAGRYDTALAVIGKALAARPGDVGAQTAMAWTDLELHRPDDALRRFGEIRTDMTWNSPLMGRAISRWQTHRNDDGLKDFELVVEHMPEWRNPRWVKTLFSASVAQSVAELDVESRKRQAAHRFPSK